MNSAVDTQSEDQRHNQNIGHVERHPADYHERKREQRRQYERQEHQDRQHHSTIVDHEQCCDSRKRQQDRLQERLNHDLSNAPLHYRAAREIRCDRRHRVDEFLGRGARRDGGGRKHRNQVAAV